MQLNLMNFQQTKAKHKCRHCVYDLQNRFYFKIYCNDWERETGITKWIKSVHQKCVRTTVALFPTLYLKPELFGLVPGVLCGFLRCIQAGNCDKTWQPSVMILACLCVWETHLLHPTHLNKGMSNTT